MIEQINRGSIYFMRRRFSACSSKSSIEERADTECLANKIGMNILFVWIKFEQHIGFNFQYGSNIEHDF